MIWLWVLCGILFIVIVILCVKLITLKIGMNEISTELTAILSSDTNTLISISSNDKDLRRLAVTLNRELRTLRKQRQRYQSGDRELKDAVTNISHDLRTPLTAISGYTELLENEELSQQSKRYIALIKSRTAALSELTEELFKYSLIISARETLPLEDLPINGILEESIAAAYETLTAHAITPEIHITETPILRSIIKPALSRVFGNILNNAVKYSDGDLSVILSDNGDIIFSNTAKKLTEIEVGKLFNRFFSVETAKGGAGLGLSIAKTLIMQMNGNITANFENGKLSIKIMIAGNPEKRGCYK
jgi:signal transduction histidine kinase